MKKAFALVRVSTSEQETDSQTQELRHIANKLGYEILPEDVFGEKISGYDEDESKDRESIIKLEEQIRLRKPDAIVVWELSRLTRRAIKVQRYIDRLSVMPKVPMYFADYELWTLDPNTHTTNDENIMKLVGGARGVELERERIKERTSRGRNAKAEKGYFVGHLADGYTWKYENGEKVIKVDDDRAELIEKIFTMYVQNGYSQGMIRDILNSEIDKYPPTNRYRKLHPEKFRGYKDEYKDKSGNIFLRSELRWMDTGVSQILKDEWYKGTRYYHGKPYNVPAIVDEDLWEQAQKRLESLSFMFNPTRRKYLLTGRLYCGKCGRKMYGHGDGYSNMYYCSSKEYGNDVKCGLRWIRQENLDSIVFNIIKARASEDIEFGHKTVFSDFFETDTKKAKEIDKDIKALTRIISRFNEETEILHKQIDFFVGQQGRYWNDEFMVAQYDKKIKEAQHKIKVNDNKIVAHSVAIDRLKKQKKMLLSVAEKLTKVSALKDFDEMKSLVFAVLSRIVIYNPDNASSVIKIEYVNGEIDYAIYYPAKLPRRFVFLSQDYQNRTKMKYDDERKAIVFDGYYLAVGAHKELVFDEKEEDVDKRLVFDDLNLSFGVWDTPENRKKYNDQIMSAAAQGVLNEAQIQQAKKLYNDAVKGGVIWKNINHAIQCLAQEGLTVFKDSVTVKEYVSIKRTGHLQVYSYDDLLPMTEVGIRRKNWHREYYRKKYNTGKPTFTGFVEKDADYERINKERKHLYNRKYKILQNKHLTDEQKEEQIMKIMEKLEAYKHQVKYLPTNKKGKDYKKKYNSQEPK